MIVTKDTLVEDFMDLPGVMAYCIMNKVSPFSCAGTYPQSLGKLLEVKNCQDPDGFIAGLNKLLAELPSK